MLLVLIIIGSNATWAQDNHLVSEKISELNEVVAGMNERLATAESDLAKLTKIKVSGYIQAQYQHFESPAVQPDNYFSLRRVRVKFTYQMFDAVRFVLQPDFVPGNLAVKDAYVVVNEPWLKSFSLTAGKFNRPNYEVEYSSSTRELTERSLIIRTLYPGERAIGAKLEYHPLELPVKVQLAVLNGNEGLTIANSAGTNLNSNENKDFDQYKDIMARVTYGLTLGSFGGLDLGLHTYFGTLKSNAGNTLDSDYSTLTETQVGDPLHRNWLGAEFQLYADILGGMSLKGEYLAGKNATVGYAPVAATSTTSAIAGKPNFQNHFSGYYLYLIKNLGKKNKVALRYDYYDPNTDITGKDVMVKGFTSNIETLSSRMSGKSDLATSTLGLAFHHYFDENIRITLNYDIVSNEKVGSTGLLTESYTLPNGTKVANGIDYGTAINQNVLTLRIQAKF